MGGVDLADQLQGTYCIDEGVRNRKWWWSILFWSIGVMITNTYVIYLHVNIDNGKHFIIKPWFKESFCACMDQSKRARWRVACPCSNNKAEFIFRFKSVVTLWLFKHLRGSKEDRITHKWCESWPKRCNVNWTGDTVWSPSTAPTNFKTKMFIT